MKTPLTSAPKTNRTISNQNKIFPTYIWHSCAQHKHRHTQEQHKVPLRYARPKRWCSTSPMCATTISRTSLHTALMSQLSSSFWPFRSTTPTFLCTSSTLPRFFCGKRPKERSESIDYKWVIKLLQWQRHEWTASWHKFTSVPLLKREQIRRHRAHWPSSQTQAHGSSAMGVKIKRNCQSENL